MNPLVSIIIPCYNYGHLISETLENVLGQRYTNWECIVVDDGSVDDSAAVISRFVRQDGRFRYVHQENRGLSGARNKGLELATGQYIQFLDADDLLAANKIALHVRFLEERPDVDLVYSDVWMFVNGTDHLAASRKFELSRPPQSGSGAQLVGSLVEDNIFLVHCPLIRATAFGGGLRFNETLRALEDWHFWYRLALLGAHFEYLQNDGCRCYVRSHGGNMSAEKKRMWYAKIKAREDLMRIEQGMARERRLVGLSPAFVSENAAHHKALLNRDQARYELYFGNVLLGLKHMAAHGWYARKPYFAFYDGAYWIKERIKGSKTNKK